MTKTMEELEDQADKVRVALGVDHPEDKLRALILAIAKTINEAYGMYGQGGTEMRGLQVVNTLEGMLTKRGPIDRLFPDIAFGDKPDTDGAVRSAPKSEPGSNVIVFNPTFEITATISQKLHRWLTEHMEEKDMSMSLAVAALLEEMLRLYRFDLKTNEIRP